MKSVPLVFKTYLMGFSQKFVFFPFQNVLLPPPPSNFTNSSSNFLHTFPRNPQQQQQRQQQQQQNLRTTQSGVGKRSGETRRTLRTAAPRPQQHSASSAARCGNPRSLAVPPCLPSALHRTCTECVVHVGTRLPAVGGPPMLESSVLKGSRD